MMSLFAPTAYTGARNSSAVGAGVSVEQATSTAVMAPNAICLPNILNSPRVESFAASEEVLRLVDPVGSGEPTRKAKVSVGTQCGQMIRPATAYTSFQS